MMSICDPLKVVRSDNSSKSFLRYVLLGCTVCHLLCMYPSHRLRWKSRAWLALEGKGELDVEENVPTRNKPRNSGKGN